MRSKVHNWKLIFRFNIYGVHMVQVCCVVATGGQPSIACWLNRRLFCTVSIVVLSVH